MLVAAPSHRKESQLAAGYREIGNFSERNLIPGFFYPDEQSNLKWPWAVMPKKGCWPSSLNESRL